MPKVSFLGIGDHNPSVAMNISIIIIIVVVFRARERHSGVNGCAAAKLC
jgi:hypothetical protein